jgi:hypothetical protein
MTLSDEFCFPLSSFGNKFPSVLRKSKKSRHIGNSGIARFARDPWGGLQKKNLQFAALICIFVFIRPYSGKPEAAI